MNRSGRITGAVTALLVFLGLGLFGTVGWLAALVLAVIAGGLLALVLQWLVDDGVTAMDAGYWAPEPVHSGVVAPVRAVSVADPLPLHETVETVPEADNLRAIKGIGVKVEQALLDAGITRFAQIAAWDEAMIDQMAGRIGRAAARIRNDDWVGQARELAAGRRDA